MEGMAAGMELFRDFSDPGRTAGPGPAATCSAG